MKIIQPEFNYECPFMYEKTYMLSEYTSGMDILCTLFKDKRIKDCAGWGNAKCPLKINGSIIVKGQVDNEKT